MPLMASLHVKSPYTGACMLSHELLKILVCPVCHGGLTPEGESGLLCPPCGLLFPVRDGIPVMLADEAEKVAPRTTGGTAS